MITKEDVLSVAKTCNDPEIGIDIATLGLIYDVQVHEKNTNIKMTFTSPMCPYGPQIVEELKTKLLDKGVAADIEVVFSPPWQPSEEVKEMLGLG